MSVESPTINLAGAFPVIKNNVVAAGNSQAAASSPKGTWIKVTSVPTKGAGIVLLPAIAGLECTVIRADNFTDNVLAIYGAGTDLIAGGSVVAIAGSIELKCFARGFWEIVSGIGIYNIDIVAGIGALSVTAIEWALARATPFGAGAIAAAMVHNPVAAATLAGGSAAHG